MKKRKFLIALSWLVIMPSFAQEKAGNLTQAATNALNPIAQVVKLMLQPNYYMYNNGGNEINLMTRVISPFDAILIPGFKPKNKKIFSLVRVEIPITSQTYGSEPQLNATGLADMTLSDVVAFKTSWGKFGFGVNLGFPTATVPVLGSGKWTAGPTAIIFYNKPKHIMLGMVVNQYFSYAGSPSRPEKCYMNLQPFFDVVFTRGYFIMVNPILTFDWKNDDYTVPLALGFGKAFAKNLSSYIMPEYVVSGPTQKTLIIQFNLNAMF
jgi:hypothetical protein